ncbi:hypothetical protein FO519_010190, partial [Halicephalobus sp. NKZ332]
RGVIAVNEKGIEIQLFVDTPLSSGTAIVRMICSNNNPAPVENFVLQAAVTKAYQVELQPASSNRMDAFGGSNITQVANIKKAGGAQALRMRLKISYTIQGNQQTMQHDVSDFPGI